MRRIRVPYLQWDDDHEDLFVFIGKDVLNESPARADECDGDEQEGPFQAAKEKVSDTTGLFRLSASSTAQLLHDFMGFLGKTRGQI